MATIEKLSISINKISRVLVDLQDSVNEFAERWTEDPHNKQFIIACVREAVRAEHARSAGRSDTNGDGRRAGNAEISPADLVSQFFHSRLRSPEFVIPLPVNGPEGKLNRKPFTHSIKELVKEFLGE